MLCQVEFLRGAKFEADDRQVAIDVLRVTVSQPSILSSGRFFDGFLRS